jgi:hypothetical protein
MHNVSHNTLTAVRNYRGQPYNGRITLVRATDAPYLPDADPACGWNEMALSGVEVLFTPGNHESMFLTPNLPTLGELVNSCIEKAVPLMSGDSRWSNVFETSHVQTK